MSEQIIESQQQTIEAYKLLDTAKSELIEAKQHHIVTLEKLENAKQELASLRYDVANKNREEILNNTRIHQLEMDKLKNEYDKKLNNVLEQKKKEHAAEMIENEKNIKRKIKESLCDDRLDKEIERRVKVRKSELCVLAKELGISCSSVPSMRANIGICMKLEAMSRVENALNRELIEELD